MWGRFSVIALLFAVLWPLGVAAQTSADAVKIGVLTDLNGPFATPTGKGSVEAAKMAVEDFVRTVLGKPIVVIAGDHKNKPDVAVALARQWFERDGVDVIADLVGSAVALAVDDLAR